MAADEKLSREIDQRHLKVITDSQMLCPN